MAVATISPNQFAYVPRWMLENFFSNISEVIPAIPRLPQHASIQLDIQGILEELSDREYRILEASLYEDMAVMLNRILELENVLLTLKSKHRVLRGPELKRPLKELAAAQRGAISSAFYFVEAYLNSLAFDALIKRAEELPERELVRLSEWDPKKNNGKGGKRYLTLREKCIHYPRLLAGQEYPLVDEATSPELRAFLSEAKDFRDSIVHASPVPQPGPTGWEKEIRFLRLNSSECVKVVDNAISLVKQRENAIFGGMKRLFWLVARDTNGRFPIEAFA